jgi:predicted RNA-binding protein associated with RNAse of E/G family
MMTPRYDIGKIVNKFVTIIGYYIDVVNITSRNTPVLVPKESH